MVQINYSAGIIKSSAIAANSKGLREGHVLNRWIEGYGTSHLPWQIIQHNKSLEPTAEAAAQFHRYASAMQAFTKS